MQRSSGRHEPRWRAVAAALVILASAASAPSRAADLRPLLDGPLAPEKAPASFRLEPGLRLELVAAEPLVVSPVALTFDERGRAFVAEDRGYPTGPGPGQPPAGRIALLEDLDGDGRLDKRTEFADGLTYPNGVMPWKGGLIVTCAPDVLYLRDNDGDGRADERRVLFTGFSTTRTTQLRVSHPTLSIDNWVYVTNGLSGGTVVNPSAPSRPPVELKRSDFRFRPDGDAWEDADGGSQFGLAFDDFGRRFICYNRVQVQHVVISSRTLRRNPHLAFSATVQDCPAETVAEPLKGHGAAARIYPISRNVTTADSHAGTFTAACAVTVYRGTGLPDSYRGGVFSCDPTGNLVHFDRLEPRGATFSARRAREGVETVASSDSWFRPVFLAHGPDGALYVCDMYRKTIEHPEYLPVEIRKNTDFESGKTMGRLWRVVRDDATADELRRLRQPDLGDKATLDLCTELLGRDGWRRDTAHRLLLERRDPAAVEPLRRIAADPEASPPSVVHALHLLASLDGLPDPLLRRTLGHRAGPVREHALQLVAPRLAKDTGWVEPILPLADDDDDRVRFQAAITLGDAPAATRSSGAEGDDLIASALARIAVRGGADRWLRAAVFSSLAGRELAFLASLAGRPAGPAPPVELLSELGRLLGTSQPPPSRPALVRLVVADRSRFSPEDRAALLTGLAEAVRTRLKLQAGEDLFSAAIGPADDRDALLGSVREILGAMRREAADPSLDLDRRRAAVGLLAYADYGQAAETLLGLLDTPQPEPLKVAAVRALGLQRDEHAAADLLAPGRFPTYTPRLRDEVLSALMSQTQHLPTLLTALEQGRIPLVAIDALRRRQLTQSRDPEVRRRAESLFGAVAGDRAKVYEEYKGVVDLKPDPANGRAVFRRECASCHRLDREGFAVGPDLFGIRNQPKPTILLHILAPDQEITQGYAAYTVATRDGRVITGLIANETPESVTIRQPLGKEDSILRSEIDELAASTQSLMPQGVEKNITRQEFADLLAYLKGEGVSSGEDRP